MKTIKKEIQGLFERGLPFYIIAEYFGVKLKDIEDIFEKYGGSNKYPFIQINDEIKMYQNTLHAYAFLKTQGFIRGYNTRSLENLLGTYINDKFIIGCITMSVAQEKEKNAIRYANGVSNSWKNIIPELVHTKEIPSTQDIWNSLLRGYATGKQSLPTEGYEPNENHFIIEHMKTVFPDQFQPIVITSSMIDEISPMIYSGGYDRDKMILGEYFGLHSIVFSKEELSIKHKLTPTRIEQILDREVRSLSWKTPFLRPDSEELFEQYKNKKDAFNTFDQKLIVILKEKKIGIPYLSEEKMKFLITPVKELYDLDEKIRMNLNGPYDYVWEIVKDSKKQFCNHKGFGNKTQGFIAVQNLIHSYKFDFNFQIPGHIENILRFRSYLRSLK